MPSYSGTFRYETSRDLSARPGPCTLDFDDESLTVIPESGSPLSCDLGDIERFSPLDYELQLTLYPGEKLVLSRFGKAFQNLCHDLQEAYRNRTIQCLLLEDLEEIERFDGAAALESPDGSFSGSAEFRLCRSNLAVLPQGNAGMQWRLAEIDAVSFDEGQYAVLIRSGEEILRVSRLGKRTQEFQERLRDAMNGVSGRSAAAVRSVFPFLSPGQFRRAADLLKEGRVASIYELAAIHEKTGPALIERVVSARLKPYYDYLVSRTAPGEFYASLRIIRKEEEAETADDAEEPTIDDPDGEGEEIGESDARPDAGDQEGSDDDILYSFIFPLRPRGGSGAPQTAAWETTSKSGRATYFFRLTDPPATGAPGKSLKDAMEVDKAVRRLNRGLLLLNFRRAPIYLPDDALLMQPRYRRYAIASRKLPAVRFLRSSFLGRALHTSPEAWQGQVESLVAGGEGGIRTHVQPFEP